MSGKIYNGDCIAVMKILKPDSIDLTVTSPPYDNLRTYNDSLEWGEHVWKPVIEQLFRVTKKGGVVVWVVGDAVVKGSETGTSFKQALYFKEVGFNLHDTMLYCKKNPLPNAQSKRYRQSFEYMFVFTRGDIKTFNPIMVEIKRFDHGKYRTTDGELTKRKSTENKNTHRKIDNIFSYGVGGKTNDHPATFPDELAHDHIVSWSNSGDVVFDPFMGSGTTGKMSKLNGRSFIGIEKDPNYYVIAKNRIISASI